MSSRPVIIRCSPFGSFNPYTITKKLEVLEDARFRSDISVDRNLQVTGTTTLKDDVLVQDADLTVQGTIDTFGLYVNGHYLVPPGTVVSYISSTSPTGWLLCDGTTYLKAAYTVLASVLGTTFGGDATHFVVPDLRGRSVIGQGAGTSLTTRTLGQSGGSETHTLSLSEIPSHTHTGTTDSAGSHTHTHNANGGNDGTGLVQDTNTNTANSTDASSNEFNLYQLPIGLSLDSAGSHTHTFTTASSGTGGSHNNMHPYVVLNYIIKY